MNESLPQISIVAPLFNETESIANLAKRLNAVMDASGLRIEIVLVDDGSKDDTPALIAQLALSDPRYKSVFLARNYGHQTALTAGLSVAAATEAILMIDGDGQDPPELLPKMYALYQQGYDVVYAVRKKRKENFFKRAAYSLFYRLLKSISYIDLPLDSGDFSLVSRRVADVLNQMPEESRFIRGMRSWIGFDQTGIEYEREERTAGTSKYGFRQLVALAYNGVFNFSEFPIKLIKRIGYFSIGVSFLYVIYSVWRKVFYGDVPQGYTSLLFVIIFFSGVQLFFLGILGEYVLRIFFQVKGRPLFIIKQIIAQNDFRKKQ